MEIREKSWTIVEFDVPAEHEDLAAWLMVRCGATGSEVNPGSAVRVVLSATFKASSFHDSKLEEIRINLEEYGLSEALKSLRIREIQEEDWLAKWKEGFVPFSVGEKFLVCPPWAMDNLPPMERPRRVLQIEPGMAFGTGLHQTTQFCMTAMEQIRLGCKAVDVGTGSGILAIAYVMLNPSARVTAIDTDPVAIESARNNLQLNNVEDKIDLVLGSCEKVIGKKFDSILSNLTCEDIVALLPEYVEILAPTGRVFCAGILSEKVPMLIEALKKYPLRIVEQKETKGWTGLVLQS